MTGSFAVYANQFRELTRCEWRAREQSTLLGFLWTLLNPLLMFLVLYMLFTRWMGGFMANYPGYLLIGLVQFGLFTYATTSGMRSLNSRKGIMLNFIIPRELLVFTNIGSVVISHAFEVALMLGFLIALGAVPRLSWLAFPLIDAIQLLFVTGLALALSVLAVRFIDFERIWSIITTAGFFLTPVFYSTAAIGANKQNLLRFNPMAHIITLARDCLLGGRFPAWRPLAALTALAVLVAAIGYALFKSQEQRLGDHVLP